MKPGTKVRVTFPPTGCSCGCGRSGTQEGVVIDGNSAYRGVPVQYPSGKRFYEMPQHVTEVKS